MEDRWISLKSVFIYFFFISSATLLTACGGGGGGGGGVKFPAAAIPYTGLNTPATLDPAGNDTESVGLGFAMASGESQGSEFVFAAELDATRNASAETELKARKIISNIVKSKIKNNVTSDQLVTGPGIAEVGNCSPDAPDGSISYEVLEQSSTKAIVRMSFNSLCDTDGANYRIIMNGDIYATAYINSSGDATRLEMYMPEFFVNYTDLSVFPNVSEYIVFTSSSVEITHFDANGFPESYTLQVSVNVYHDGTVYKFEESGTYDFFTDGMMSTDPVKFYHPDYGSVEYNVTTPFTYNCADGTPDAGKVVLTASNGSATFTVNACNNYTVNVAGLSVP